MASAHWHQHKTGCKRLQYTTIYIGTLHNKVHRKHCAAVGGPTALTPEEDRLVSIFLLLHYCSANASHLKSFNILFFCNLCHFTTQADLSVFFLCDNFRGISH